MSIGRGFELCVGGVLVFIYIFLGRVGVVVGVGSLWLWCGFGVILVCFGVFGVRF